MSEDSRGNVWICTYDRGVCQILPDGRMRRWTTTNGLGSVSTRFVFEDRESNLWIGTSGGGLARFRLRRFQSIGAESGLTERNVNSVWPSQDGGLWIGTQGKGLFRLHDGGVTNVLLPIDDATIYVQSVLNDRAGRLWLGTSRDLWRSDQGVFRTIRLDPPRRADIHALFEDSHGRIWIGGRGGAAVLDGENLRVFTTADGLPADAARCFAEDSRSVIWLSTLKGVFRWENDRFVEFQSNGQPLRNITCMKADADGALWMGSLDNGLLCRRGGRLARIGAETGLPIRAVHGIVEDAIGYFWLASNRGVVRVLAKDLRLAAEGEVPHLDCHLLDLSDGLPSVECASEQQPTCARDARGRLWFATMKGVAMIDPAGFRLNTNLPPVRIEELIYRAPVPRGVRQLVHPSTPSKEIEVRLSAPFSEPLRLPPGSRQIEIHYTALSFSAPEKVRFQTRLDGTDYSWEEQQNQRVTRYYEQPPGDYVFRVRAANNDGLWNESGASLAFTVQPFLLQTRWFRVAAFAALFGCGGFTTWGLVRRRHQREMQELERTRQHQVELAHVARVSSMGQLASSLAHELNQPLGAILRNAEAAELFLQDSSPDLDEVRAILADIRKDDQRAGEVIDRMRALMKRREVEHRRLDLNLLAGEVVALVRPDAEMRRVRLAFESNPALPPVHGDGVQLQQVMLNLLLNALDALNDHPPERRLITVSSRPAGAAVEVAVSDTGPGIPADKLPQIFEPFYTSKPNGLGMGLTISRSIVETHRGRIRAENNPAGGVTFTLTLPVAEGERGSEQ